MSESLSLDIVFEREGLRALWVGLADGLNGEDGGETVLSYKVGVDIEADFVWFAIVKKGKRKAMRRRWWSDAKVASGLKRKWLRLIKLETISSLN